MGRASIFALSLAVFCGVAAVSNGQLLGSGSAEVSESARHTIVAWSQIVRSHIYISSCMQVSGFDVLLRLPPLKLALQYPRWASCSAHTAQNFQQHFTAFSEGFNRPPDMYAMID